MSSVKEKLAALRAKRTAHKSVPSTSTSDALNAAALALGEPQVSWDEDYKVRLEEHDSSHDVKQSALSSCSTDEDDDELVVLPPPTRKLNPAAQRQLWRMREIERARVKAAKNLMDSRPASFDVDEIPIEPCSEDPTAADEAEGDGAGRGDDEEDEEEAARHRQESEDFADPDAPEEDEEEAALECAQRIEEEEMEDEEDELPLRPAQNACNESDESRSERPNNDVIPQNEPLSAAGMDHPVARDRQGPEERQNTREHYSAPEASDEVSKAPEEPSNSSKLADDKIAASDPKESSRLEPFEESSKPTGGGRLEEKRFSTGFVEEEADDDEGGENENGAPQLLEACFDNARFSEEQDVGAEEYDEEVEQENIDPSDNKKLAAFHQKWILEKDRSDMNAMKSGSGRIIVDNVDDAMDLTELVHAGVDDKGENGNISEAEEGVPDENDFANDDKAKSNNYVEAMFLRDDSRSKFLEEENEEADENDEDDANRREKARALWKTRQKTKISLFQEDENSLSRFDIFGDTDKSRSAHFRMQLENACRPVLQKDVDERSRIDRDHRSTGVKRNDPWSSERSVPEWEKRNACFQEKQRKRQRSVSVGKWSFAAHGEKEKVPSKASKTGSSGAGNASMGSTYLARKSRSRAIAPNRNQASSSRPAKTPRRLSSKGPTSFKGLLSILGNRAETDL